MLRPSHSIAGVFALVFVLVAFATPEARTSTPRSVAPNYPIAPSALQLLGTCPSVERRLGYEGVDCLQSTRLDLITGDITLEQAIHRLEACAGERGDLEPLALASMQRRLHMLEARAAFGETLETADLQEQQRLSAELGGAERHIPPASLARLRAAGIASTGFLSAPESRALRRISESTGLRADFREVFGDGLADDLDAVLDPSRTGPTPAVRLGDVVLVPNRPETQSESNGSPPAAEPLIVDAGAYVTRLVTDLRRLELDRRRYLESASLQHQRTGSFRVFLSNLKELGDDADAAEIRAEAERNREIMHRRYASLQARLGVGPLLGRMAEESLGVVAEVDRSCGAVAENRLRWIHRGSGLVAGLVGAAGVVVATGTTGTMMGGVIIAAAVEASLGAYLMARSEHVIPHAPPAARRQIALPVDLDERRFARQASSFDLGDGNVGLDGRDHDIWSPELGDAKELGLEAGEIVEEEEGELESFGPRENTIPPILPLETPDELTELPPLLAGADLQELRDLTLPEIQERIDEFLALNDPRMWAELSESDEPMHPLALEEMIEEAKRSLKQWEEQRQLSERFGPFFIQAELEGVAERRRQEVLMTAMGRYLGDRAYLEGSKDIEDLRGRVAARLVTHCRGTGTGGDLILTACRDETALSILLVAALRDAGLAIPFGSVLGVQAVGNRFQAVLFSREQDEVFSLTNGRYTEGVIGPIYHPAVFYAGYLEAHGVVPEIDANRHLLIALPNRAAPPEEEVRPCGADNEPGAVGRAVRWIGSMMGVRGNPQNDPCRGPSTRSADNRRSGVNVDVNLPRPRNPLARAGGGQSGGGQGGSGGSSGAQSSGAGSEPGGSSGDEQSGGGEAGSGGGQGDGSASSASPGDPASGPSAASGEQGAAGEAQDASGGGQGGTAQSGDGGSPDGGAAGREGSGGVDGGSDSRGTGGSGGFGVGNSSGLPSADLVEIGHEAVELSHRYERAGNLRVTPWRLRADEGMASGATSGVLYADNARALERFGADELFITLAPAEVEAQRRMLEADAQPIFSAETECGAPNLPQRGVFRRASSGDPGYRYVFCDQSESMVVFRERRDAQSYAALNAPDRPLYLARLAAERLERFERSPEMARIQAFLNDPNVLRGYSRDELRDMARVAADLLVFQNALESALVQSMNELGPSGVRTFYYDMHRQVLQAPFFIHLAERVYRLNQRLASDPLQSLAWANAQPRLARQGFFELHYLLGGVMEWPERWAVLQQRYGAGAPPPPSRQPDALSLDFLHILSDPQRVQVDWQAERVTRPSIRDRQAQDGVARSSVVRPEPTLSEKLDLQELSEHLRGGTGGFGDSGDGDSIGPESGRRPLQMIHIRVVPDDGDPDRKRMPDDNQVRPGGTAGAQRKQTEESATRQEPLLWVAPETFIDGILSTWDRGEMQPTRAAHVPPVIRFNERLRQVFLRQMRASGAYENRLRGAMEVFTAGGWLRYAETRDAMGGQWTGVKAFDTGRFSAAYSGNAPINDQDQIRIPNFFSSSPVIIPADLYDPVREHYHRSILGIFDLGRESRIPEPVSLRAAPVPPGENTRAARQNLLRTLEMIREQAAED